MKTSTSIAMHRHSYSVVDILPSESDAAIQMMQVQEKPDVTFADIGGCDTQKQELREAVELPLTYPELYSQIGIDPPKGVEVGEGASEERKKGSKKERRALPNFSFR